MPPVSKKQQRLMQAVAHSKKFAQKVGIPQKVGREFSGPVAPKKRRSHDTMKHGYDVMED